jgi:two-component system, NtrC family, sensor histidine kinase GlrK
MRIKYPKSFLKLLLLGFALAILPLMLAFINTNVALNQLSQKSQSTIDNAVKATRASMVLQQQLHLMERSSRQYFVLQDADLFKRYLSARMTFLDAVQTLKQLNMSAALQDKLLELETLSNKTHNAIVNAQSNHTEETEFLNAFNQIAQQVDGIIQQNNQLIDSTSTQLAVESKQAQSRFFLQSLILIPLTFLVTAIIAYMLGRPIRRMDNAIKHLGHGDYQQAISIDGPGDLRILGQRLDWLRLALLNLKEQKQQFLQHISHELKTPLTAIREAAELLNDEVGGKLSVQQQEIITIMRDNSLRLQKMIEHLLNFTKMESEKNPVQITSIDVATFLTQLTDSHALSIRNKQLRINVQIALSTLMADESKLLIIMDNLISNAIKYTPLNGQITLSTKQDKHWQLIEVMDSGPGLSIADKARLFDPFYQGKATHQSLVNSSGLGLSIAKNLTEEHHGAIELVETETGAHFIVRLPKLMPQSQEAR